MDAGLAVTAVILRQALIASRFTDLTFRPRLGVQDEFGEVGPVDYLQERFGLTAQAICEKAKKAIARK